MRGEILRVFVKDGEYKRLNNVFLILNLSMSKCLFAFSVYHSSIITSQDNKNKNFLKRHTTTAFSSLLNPYTRQFKLIISRNNSGIFLPFGQMTLSSWSWSQNKQNTILRGLTFHSHYTKLLEKVLWYVWFRLMLSFIG